VELNEKGGPINARTLDLAYAPQPPKIRKLPQGKSRKKHSEGKEKGG